MCMIMILIIINHRIRQLWLDILGWVWSIGDDWNRIEIFMLIIKKKSIIKFTFQGLNHLLIFILIYNYKLKKTLIEDKLKTHIESQ